MLLANIITDLVSDLTDWLEDISAEWWFLVVILVIAFLDSVIPIVPSETAVIIGGVAAGAGDQNLWMVIGAGALGRLPRRQHRLPHRQPLRAVVRAAGEDPREDGQATACGPTTRSRSVVACC